MIDNPGPLSTRFQKSFQQMLWVHFVKTILVDQILISRTKNTILTSFYLLNLSECPSGESVGVACKCSPGEYWNSDRGSCEGKSHGVRGLLIIIQTGILHHT